MFKHLIGRYFPTQSKLHYMNAFIKMICLLLFMITIAYIKDALALFLVLVVLVMMLLLSKIPLWNYLKVLKSLFSLILFIILIALFSRDSLWLTFISIMKISIGVLYTNMIVFTTTPSELIYGLELLLKPLKFFKVNPSKLAMTISLALQFIPSIFIQMDKVVKSQASRGIDFHYEKWDGKIKALSSMIVPILYLTIKRADELADAMSVRLYDMNGARTNYKIRSRTNVDENILVVHAVLMVLVLLGGYLWQNVI